MATTAIAYRIQTAVDVQSASSASENITYTPPSGGFAVVQITGENIGGGAVSFVTSIGTSQGPKQAVGGAAGDRTTIYGIYVGPGKTLSVTITGAVSARANISGVEFTNNS